MRPIASPFGSLPTPGFNVPDTALTNPMASLLASLTPSRQDVADTLGAPVDAIAWALHRVGVPISGDKFYGGNAFNRAPGSGQPTWAPGPGVRFGSQNIRGMLDNGPSLDALLMASRRHGLF